MKQQITDKDRKDLLFGLDQGVDWVALSFVRNPQDILEIKDIIGCAEGTVKSRLHRAITRLREVLGEI